MIDTIPAYLQHLANRGASENTLRAYAADLKALQQYTWDNDWKDLERFAACVLNDARKRQSPKTVLRKLGTFRAWARWAEHPQFLDDYRPPRPAAAEPHPLPEGIDGVLRMIESTRNPRHKALIALCGLCGLRVDEAVNIKPEHIIIRPDDIVMMVRGKGDKTRVVPVTETAWKYITKAHDMALDNNTTITRLTNRGGRASITRHAIRAGLSRHVSSHDLRATFATAAYAKSKDLRAVQELLGHADPKTTLVYTGISMAARRSAAEVA